MLLIQSHLKNKIETLESLQERFGIHSKVSSCGKLVKLDYDQIESSGAGIKDHRLVRESRGLVLENETWNLVAKSFNRFFNYRENADTENFDWKNFSTFSKEDGSLLQVTVYENEIRYFTRFSFADQPISDLINKTWKELAESCLSDGQKAFIKSHPKYTFVFEFCSPYTQVVKFYDKPQMIMTGIFDNQMGEEVSVNSPVYKQAQIMFKWAEEYHFKNIDEIIAKLDLMFLEGSSDEGFVLKDNNGIRLKIKNKKYLLLHRLSNNGGVKNLKSLIPIVMQGETSEIEAYFPGLIESLEKVQEMIKKDIDDLKEVYYNVITKESQKDFALYLTKEIYTPFSSLFFNLRKEFGNSFTFAQVEEAFMNAEDLVIKVYKSRGILKDEEE